jgi:hypothetical protein
MTIQAASYAPAQQLHQPMSFQGLSLMIQGFAKAGKSTLADSGPRPTLIIDVEGTSVWTPSRKIRWDPDRETVPYPDGTWDSAVVIVREARTVMRIYNILNSGQHYFNSLSIDSVTEVQQRIIDDLTMGRTMDRDKWGTLLRQINTMIRAYRDLITHPVKPLWSVAMTAGTHNVNGRWRPLLQGASQDYTPYYVDVLGYLGASPDGTRTLMIGPHPQFETGERVGGRLPPLMQIGDGVNHPGYTIETMLAQVMNGGRSR